MDIVNSLGSIATVLFIAATVFQAVKSWKDGHAESMSHGMLWSWAIGLSAMLIYVTVKFGFDPILFANYGGQLVFVSIIMRYKYIPRNKL